MAEFIEVVKKKNEMCNCYNVCTSCPLHMSNNLHGIGCASLIRSFPQDAEEIIMNWEKPVIWESVKVDTPILVRDDEGKEWLKRYFAKYEDDKVFAWQGGMTSWSVGGEEFTTDWNYAKLAVEEANNG